MTSKVLCDILFVLYTGIAWSCCCRSWGDRPSPAEGCLEARGSLAQACGSITRALAFAEVVSISYFAFARRRQT